MTSTKAQLLKHDFPVHGICCRFHFRDSTLYREKILNPGIVILSLVIVSVRIVLRRLGPCLRGRT